MSPPRTVTFRMVAVQHARWRFRIHHEAEFPGQVVGILHADVHALAADVGDNIRGIPAQKDPADVVRIRLTAVDTVVRFPHRITEYATRATLVEDGL